MTMPNQIDKLDEIQGQLIGAVSAEFMSHPDGRQIVMPTEKLLELQSEAKTEILKHYISREEAEKNRMLAQAEAQLLGWTHGKSGFDIESLVDSMGLTLAEWHKLQKDYHIDYLTEQNIADINAAIKANTELRQAINKIKGELQ